MNPQPTPEQRQEWQNAVNIGNVISRAINTPDYAPVRINPQTLKEAVGIYHTLGAKKPILQRSEQFVGNCVAYDGEIFAACAQRFILCYYMKRTDDGITRRDVVYWYGNGKVKEREPLDNVRFFLNDNRFMIASFLINHALFLQLQQYLSPQP